MKSFSRIISASAQHKLKAHLKAGGLLAYPTESCYGLGCLPNHEGALRKLIRLKKRPQHKGMIVIGDKFSRLQPLLKKVDSQTQAMLEQTWPAPITFLLPAGAKILPALRGMRRQKIAVRVPAHRSAAKICSILDTPIVSTSCNRAGKRACKTAREAKRQFGSKVWIIGGMIGRQKTPSQIIDAETGRRMR